MTHASIDFAPPLEHVLILAPYRRDADYLCQLLSEQDIHCEIGTKADDLPSLLADAPALLLVTHEALRREVIEDVGAHLNAQPDWSELPIIVLLDKRSDNARVRSELSRAWPGARHLFYLRPVAPVELVSGVQSALLARLRQRDVRDHIAREVELRRELNHRVKNILASVSSIFEMTRRGANSVSDLTDDFRGRLDALSRVHSAVFQADGDNVSLCDLAGLTFEPYRSAGSNRISATGPDVMVSPEAGTTLALCLHELATNASKYGALSVPDGKVDLTWSVSGTDDPDLTVRWLERDGPVIAEPANTGYGTRYIRSALAAILGNKPDITFHATGLECVASGPLARVAGNQ